MKKLLAITSALICCMGNEYPAKAEIYRSYNGDYYTRCNFVGRSVFCAHNDEARDLDRRHAAKNKCLDRLDKEWDAKYPEAYQETADEINRKKREQFPEIYGAIAVKADDLTVTSMVAAKRHHNPSYQKASKACFAKNGF